MLKILKLFFVLLLVLLILGSCADNEKSNLSEKLNTNKQQNGGDRKEETAHENEIIDPTLSSQEKIYVLFSLSTHDWVFPEESIAVLNKMIDIHEKYNVPIELYLDDQVMQIYYEQSPELIERLKTSPVVAVSYHIRPPTPYYKELEFDFIGLEALDEITLKETLLDYEEHAIDLETGEPTNAAGGYEFVKDIIGYAPLTVSGFEKYGDLGTVLRNLYYEKGALFLVLHSQLGDEDPTAVDLGEKREPLYARPSTVDVRLFAAASGMSKYCARPPCWGKPA